MQVFSNPDSHNKKDVLMTIQAFRLLIFSSFIVYFNEKPILTKLMSILKLQGPLYVDIKETVLKNTIELSKHYSIRQAFLGK